MPTLKDVAKKANVSQMTVSRVLNHPDAVSDELKTLVFSAMKALNYQPNAMAKALADNRTNVIKILVLEDMTHAEPYYMRVLSGISQALKQQQYFLQFPVTSEQNFTDCDGVIVMGAKKQDYTRLRQIKKPLVCFGENPYFDFVDTANQKNIYQATHYAYNCGYQKLYYVGLKRSEPFATKRYAGYQQAMQELGLAPESFMVTAETPETLAFLSTTTFKKNSAFICATDRLALEVSSQLEQQGALPQDFGVIGHDGVLLDRISHPQLSTYAQNFETMGSYLAEMLLAKIFSKAHLPSKLFDGHLIVRQTTRRPQNR